MKTIRTIVIGTITASLLMGGGAVSAATASEAVLSEEGRPLIESVTIAGTGDFDELDGAVSESSFRHPSSVAVTADGSILVSDTSNHRIRQIQNGSVSVFAGIGISVLFDEGGIPTGALQDGTSDQSLFQHPMGIDVDAAGNVYVADSENHAIRKVSPQGIVTTIAGNGVLGFANGNGSDASFHAPHDVAVTANGTVYVADTLNHAIRRIDPNGNVTTLNAVSSRIVELFPGIVESAGDFADGELSEAIFNEPMGLELDARGNLYVSDAGNQRIRYIDMAQGTVRTVAGGGEYVDNALYAEGFYIDGEASEARFYNPRGLALDSEGGLYIADALNHSIRYLKDGQVSTVVGNAEGNYGAADGVDEFIRIYRPMDVAMAADGSLLIADALNNKIRKISYYSLPAGWSEEGGIKVLYDQEPIAFDAKPEIRSDRTMVPVRAIAETLGYEVSFEGDKILLAGTDRIVTLTLGKQEVIRTEGDESRTQAIDVAPYVDEQRTYVPIRFFAEEIGVDVEWHNATTTVILRDRTK